MRLDESLHRACSAVSRGAPRCPDVRTGGGPGRRPGPTQALWIAAWKGSGTPAGALHGGPEGVRDPRGRSSLRSGGSRTPFWHNNPRVQGGDGTRLRKIGRFLAQNRPHDRSTERFRGVGNPVCRNALRLCRCRTPLPWHRSRPAGTSDLACAGPGTPAAVLGLWTRRRLLDHRSRRRKTSSTNSRWISRLSSRCTAPGTRAGRAGSSLPCPGARAPCRERARPRQRATGTNARDPG